MQKSGGRTLFARRKKRGASRTTDNSLYRVHLSLSLSLSLSIGRRAYHKPRVVRIYFYCHAHTRARPRQRNAKAKPKDGGWMNALVNLKLMHQLYYLLPTRLCVCVCVREREREKRRVVLMRDDRNGCSQQNEHPTWPHLTWPHLTWPQQWIFFFQNLLFFFF